MELACLNLACLLESCMEMAYVSSEITNATLLLVRSIEERFSQTEKNAIIEVGIVIGACASVCLIACVILIGRYCCLQNGGDAPCLQNGGSKDAVMDSTDSVVEEGVDNEGGAPSVANTEGAYRSDSDSDDEGQSVKLSKEAQKRSRSTVGV